MKNIAQQYITHKLKNLTTDELIYYSQMHNIPLTYQEAEQIVKELKKNRENPFDKKGRKRMLRKLAQITSVETAQSVDVLLHRLAKQYGVEEWLQ
ncbi:DUF2624 family protein [Halobacillus sp. A5]|uniref:DUF2624 family protein n=1 Tax=Halobacillus sp. A5 TaxID=2880263 RepID=UPI0020A6569C|nr:DUF2624 family protein [Halobacillus sp. A5]MCP3025661.1 DUF2624 domain-containing protein [Halobacillus sp. A5]